MTTPPPTTGEREIPSTHGAKLDYKSFEYSKEDDYYVATKKVISRLFEALVYLTVTTTDIEEFKSVKVFISTIAAEDIFISRDNKLPELEITKDKEHLTHLFFTSYAGVRRCCFISINFSGHLAITW